MTKLHHFRLN